MTEVLASHNASRWWNRLARQPAILLLATGALLLLLLNPNWKIDPDSVCYLSMARSLAHGGGMRRLGLQHWYYAPLYPVFISPAFWFSHHPFLLISVLNVVTAWTLIAGTYCWFSGYSKQGATLIAALVGVNVGMWDVCREPRADVLFSALLVWSAYFLTRVSSLQDVGWAPPTGGHSPPCALHRARVSNLAMGTLLLVLACLTRAVGIFLAAGFVVALFLRWRRKQVTLPALIAGFIPGLVATAALVCLLAYEHHTSRLDHEQTATYVNQMRDPAITLGTQIGDGIRRQSGDIGRLLLPGMWGSWGRTWLDGTTLLYLILAVVILTGWWRLAWKAADPLLWIVPFYGVMFIIWPFDQGTRFNVPMLPVMWASVWMLLDRWPKNRGLILTILLALHAGASGAYLFHDAAKVGKSNQTIPDLTELTSVITMPDSVGTLNLEDNDRWIATYLLDRRVVPLRPDDAKSIEGVHWLITRKSALPPHGFVFVKLSGPFQLCRPARELW